MQQAGSTVAARSGSASAGLPATAAAAGRAGPSSQPAEVEAFHQPSSGAHVVGGAGPSGSARTTAAPYHPSSILVTGGAGFIGSHVAQLLVERYPQYKVVVYDKLDVCASLHNLQGAQGAPNFIFVKGDILSGDLVSFVLEQHSIDTVLHFAAQTHVDNSFGNSLAFTMNNTYGTHVLLEACRRHGRIRRFINVSTDEVYGESSLGLEEGLPEDSTLMPTNPYAAAKAGAEMLAAAFHCSYHLPVITTRSNNVYGPQQFPEKLVPKLTLLASRGDELPIHGDGLNTRSYMYVADVAEAFDLILHRGTVGAVYNIGSQRERSVLEVAQDICGLLGVPECRIVHVRDRPFNDRRYFISDAKLAQLGWQERTPWEEGLRATVDWYLKHGFNGHWDRRAVETALQPHPTAFPAIPAMPL